MKIRSRNGKRLNVEQAQKLSRKTRADPERFERDFPSDMPDERFTPRGTVEEIHRIYSFTVDAFCHPKSPASEVVPMCWTKRDDSLSLSWVGQRVFAQPPYSILAECIEKGFRETSGACPLVVFLVPAWTDREWWAKFVEPFRDRHEVNLFTDFEGRRVDFARGPRRVSTRFLPGRLTFGNPNEPDVEAENLARKSRGEKMKTQAQFGMVLIEMWGRAL